MPTMSSNVSYIPTIINEIFPSGTERTKTKTDIKSDGDAIQKVGMLAFETGDLTPLIKEELKYTIQSRRLEQGKKELEVSFEEPQIRELRPDEKEKVERRREQNRLAAQRFRSKQKSLQSVLSKKTQMLEVDNTKLRAEILKLKAEKDELNRKLQDHLLICPKHNRFWTSGCGQR